jgi:hypothetical protein
VEADGLATMENLEFQVLDLMIAVLLHDLTRGSG